MGVALLAQGSYTARERGGPPGPCGRICFKVHKVNLSQVFAGQNVGVTQVGDRIWLVTFMQYDLG